mgnify:CR=1 FL=1
MSAVVNRRTEKRSRMDALTIIVNGRPVKAYTGETVHAVLLAAGITAFRKSKSGEPRGMFCGMGVCYECLVTIDGIAHQRACMRLVEPGMAVVTDDGDL